MDNTKVTEASVEEQAVDTKATKTTKTTAAKATSTKKAETAKAAEVNTGRWRLISLQILRQKLKQTQNLKLKLQRKHQI